MIYRNNNKVAVTDRTKDTPGAALVRGAVYEHEDGDFYIAAYEPENYEHSRLISLRAGTYGGAARKNIPNGFERVSNGTTLTITLKSS